MGSERRRIILDDPQVRRLVRELRPGSPASLAEVLAAARSARIVLVGDYRPSGRPKRWLMQLLDVLPRSVPLFMDVFAAKDALLVDHWRRGLVTSLELRRATRFDLELSVPVEPYARLLRKAWGQGRRTLFTESPVRSDRASRRRRFFLAARRSAREIGRGRAVFLMGQAYLESRFFPRMLRSAVRPSPGRVVTVFFLPSAREPWRLGGDRFALPLGPPPPSRPSGIKGRSREVDLDATLYRMADELLARLGVDPYRRRIPIQGRPILRDSYPQVFGRREAATAAKVLAARGLEAPEVRDLGGRLRRKGSLYVPRANAILVGRFRIVDGSEEIAHFVNFALRGDAFGSSASSFYQDVWDEAIGYLGGKLLHPARAAPSLAELARARVKGTLHDVRRFLLAHAAMERGYRTLPRVPRLVSEGLAREGAFRENAHHGLGYLLGERLHRAYRAGRLSMANVRRLFEARALGPRGALKRYLDWSRRLRSRP